VPMLRVMYDLPACLELSWRRSSGSAPAPPWCGPSRSRRAWPYRDGCVWPSWAGLGVAASPSDPSAPADDASHGPRRRRVCTLCHPLQAAASTSRPGEHTGGVEESQLVISGRSKRVLTFAGSRRQKMIQPSLYQRLKLYARCNVTCATEANRKQIPCGHSITCAVCKPSLRPRSFRLMW